MSWKGGLRNTVLDGNIRFRLTKRCPGPRDIFNSRLSRRPEKEKHRGWHPHEAVADKSTLGWIVTNARIQAVKVTLGSEVGVAGSRGDNRVDPF